MRPLVSFVMPVWNHAHLVGNAIESILNQSVKDWELVIVDDGSDDFYQLQAVLKRFQDERIKYHRLEENKGLVYARNFGNKHASSDWIAVQDSDDLSLPDRLEKCAPLMESHDVIVHGFYLNMWDSERQAISRGYKDCGNGEGIREAQTINGYPFFRKSLWEKKPFREETQFAYDWMMHADWMLGGARYGFVHEGLYEYVRQENSASQRFEKDGRRAQSFRRIKEIIKEYD